MSLVTPTNVSLQLDDNKKIEIETGKLAKQADGSVVLKVGNTMLLATVVAKKEFSETSDFLPLTVDYREKFSASGKFPGGFLKREAKPSDSEVLVSRLIDRAVRPLFPKGYFPEIQLLVSLLSVEENILPDAYACLAASAAIMVSDIPFEKSVSEVRVGRIKDDFIINPTIEQLKECDIDLIVAGTVDDIMMVEGECKEVSENEMVEAIKIAHNSIIKLCNLQIELASKIEKAKTKRKFDVLEASEELRNKLETHSLEELKKICGSSLAKKDRSEKISTLFNSFIKDNEPEDDKEHFVMVNYFQKLVKKTARKFILEDKLRLDGRKPKDIRDIWCEIDYLPSTHGSSVFTRGETQSLTSVTLGSKMEKQTIDGAVIRGEERFMLHYNFPPFSTGEVKRMMSVSRREIGHGNLAYRALKKSIKDSGTPYTIRIMSDILESNGSSSMATVCAGSLALMDAGIAIKKTVSGIAMGLISENDKFEVLSDILGDEDHLGDMDFKVTGTKDGITACQMDIKIDGLKWEILEKALLQAKDGRLHIINEMEKVISEPKKDLKSHTPRIEEYFLKSDQIGTLIGPGGKTIQAIQKNTDTVITVEEIDEQKAVAQVLSPDKDKMRNALNEIELLFKEAVVGDVYEGTVKNIVDFGAFVEFLPGKQALLHISEIDHKRVEKVGDYLKLGDKVEVKLIGIDPRTKKYKLSRKALIAK